ncbi:MAG: ADP-heptose--lipooligosaccharide heptosyltransferase II [uncultured Solirubrobacteraceae bacterium]|uniref:ADP-heptose--lipooligosaccharide heptosyltransferase II n=1 Tax=uncultured Solirubrobacteraceae bacterium TaxID=1162706 RepID=A0A6J4RMH5_9ACTN|nr:MAG: ADP-heptose--lipooligosaccharide heptosyltransferase II [uncultured Solirubrobacteraceae bacterium]
MTSRRAARPLLLSYRALGLGDLLTGIPALRALGRAFPDCRHVLCAPAQLSPLVALVDGIDAVSDTRPLAVPARELRAPAVAVNLHGRGPESHRALQALAPQRLIAFDCPAAGHAGPAYDDDEHEVRRWCRLLEAGGIPADPGDLDLRLPPGAARHGGEGATVLHPGAANAARRWPIARFAEVARRELRRGRRVLVTGSPDERALGVELAERAGLDPEAVLAGRTGLDELAGVIAGAGRVVCGDTGVGHLATALGTPSLLLFGPTAPSRWGPPAARSQHVVLWAGREGDPHADSPDAGLLELDVERVDAALQQLPGRRDARPRRRGPTAA